MTVLIGAALMGAAVFVLLPSTPIGRISSARRRTFLPSLRAQLAQPAVDPLWRALIPAGAIGIASVLTLGGTWGLIIGAGAGLFVFRLLRQKPTTSVSLRDQPALVDLLGATLSAGAAPVDALQWVGRSWPGALGEDLVRVSTAIRWGAATEEAWTQVRHPVVWHSVREAFTRSARTGAPIVDILESSARELRREHRERVEVAAHSAGVRVVLPLALCFLPAYLLWGIVPIVMSWGSGVIP